MAQQAKGNLKNSVTNYKNAVELDENNFQAKRMPEAADEQLFHTII